MARYVIEEKTLADMSAAVRDKVLPGDLEMEVRGTATSSKGFGFNIPNMAGNHFRLTVKDVEVNATSFYNSDFYLIVNGQSIDDRWNMHTVFPKVFDVYINDKTCEIALGASGPESVTATFVIEAIDDEGNPIGYTPQEMIDIINSFAPGPVEDNLVFSGECQYKFANNGWNWFIEKYGDMMRTENIGDATNMFYGLKLETLPFALNFGNENTSHLYMSDMFRMSSIKEVDINIAATAPSGWNISSTFGNCANLRRINLNHEIALCRGDSIYGMYQTFTGCNSLGELNEIPFIWSTYNTSYGFRYAFDECWRLKNLTFRGGEISSSDSYNGADIDLTKYVGWTEHVTSGTLQWDSPETKVTDADSYAALKDNPDWWTQDVAYSRYNHDSAVATLNSLPNVSSTGASSTIKFKGEAGSLTDGGAINTLTDAEIAVAAAKGWTVALS
jgi:hypothetical protein